MREPAKEYRLLKFALTVSTKTGPIEIALNQMVGWSFREMVCSPRLVLFLFERNRGELV